MGNDRPTEAAEASAVAGKSSSVLSSDSMNSMHNFGSIKDQMTGKDTSNLHSLEIEGLEGLNNNSVKAQQGTEKPSGASLGSDAPQKQAPSEKAATPPTSDSPNQQASNEKPVNAPSSDTAPQKQAPSEKAATPPTSDAPQKQAPSEKPVTAPTSDAPQQQVPNEKPVTAPTSDAPQQQVPIQEPVTAPSSDAPLQKRVAN